MTKFVVSLFAISFSLYAQEPLKHAVLISPDTSIPSEVVEFIEERGERVAVKTSDVWIVRLSEGTALELRSAFDVEVLRSTEDAGVYVQSDPSRAWITKLFSPEDDGRNLNGHDQEGEAFAIPCLVENEDEHPDAVRALMKTRDNAYATAFDPNKTSDVLVGSTTLAVFYVNNVEAQQQGVPTWTEPLRLNAHANIMVNLAWWSDQAFAYGKEKTFTVQPFWPDNPACAIDFDPTEGYTQTSFSINDHKFQNPIMDKLGYSGANQTVKMRAFCNDLRAQEQTDWAYLAFLLVGKSTVRAHASFGGPSTVLMASSAGNGFVYAHETGHVFNAFDEYFESGVSNGRARQSRFGVPNGNHHFRNYPVMPSMMAYNFRGLSGYTAVHLGLIDSVIFRRVSTDPPDAVYEVDYIAPNGSRSGLARYQGDVDFAWGLGMKLELRGLPNVTSGGMIYASPVWDVSGSTTATLDVSNATPSEVAVTYSSSNQPASTSMEYLTTGNALASEFVSDVALLGNREAAFVGMKGISLWDGNAMTILDHPIGDRGGPVYRESYAATKGPDNALYFSSHAGEIVVWRQGIVSTLRGPDPDMIYRNVAVTDDGAVWATDGGIVSGRDMLGSGLHRFHDGQVNVYTASNSPLPSNSISTIIAADGGAIRFGMGGKDPSEQGLYRFDPVTNSLTDESHLLSKLLVARLRHVGRDSLLVITRGSAPTESSGVTLITPAGASDYPSDMFTQIGSINDATLDHSGALVVVSSQGVHIERPQGGWQTFVVANSELISNNCTSVKTASNGNLFIGTNNGAVILSRATEVTSVSNPSILPNGMTLQQNHPNPAGSSTTIGLQLERRERISLRVYDALGRVAAVVADGEMGPGEFHLMVSTASFTPGMYFYRLSGPAGSMEKRMVVVK